MARQAHSSKRTEPTNSPPKKYNIINIGISWSGFLLAVLVSICVATALIWIKKRSTSTVEQFQTSKTVDARLLDSWAGQLKVERICRPVADKGSMNLSGITDKEKEFKINATLEKIPCAAIMNRNGKPRSKQVALSRLALAMDFINIFNYEGSPIASINAQNRKDFVDLILSQCNTFGESDANLDDIRGRLANKTSITLDDALYLINNYPCVKENCKSFVRRVMKVTTGTIKPNKDGTITYSIANNSRESTSSSQVSLEPGAAAPETQQVTLDTDFADLNAKFSEITNSDCNPVNSCVQGVQVDENPEFNKALDALAKSYPTSLAMELLVSKQELFKDPKNKEDINEPMEPIPEAEIVTNTTHRCSGADFYAGMSSKGPLA